MRKHPHAQLHEVSKPASGVGFLVQLQHMQHQTHNEDSGLLHRRRYRPSLDSLAERMRLASREFHSRPLEAR